jgi:hypothetical protein
MSSSLLLVDAADLVFLNLDSAQMWDPACPVLLPLGAITISPIISASMGVLIPFLIFVIAQFWYLYGIWYANVKPGIHHHDSNKDGAAGAIEANERKGGGGGAMAGYGYPQPREQLCYVNQDAGGSGQQLLY